MNVVAAVQFEYQAVGYGFMYSVGYFGERFNQDGESGNGVEKIHIVYPILRVILFSCESSFDENWLIIR